MKKMFVWIGGVFLVIVSVAIVMLAVSRKEDQIHEDALYIDNMGQFSNGEGFYYLNQENFLQFYDYKSNQNTIVCNKPNCEHKPWQEETPTEQKMQCLYQQLPLLVYVWRETLHCRNCP